MRTLEPASITLGTVDDLPQIYADMEKQFPPDEMYKYKNLLHLLHGTNTKSYCTSGIPMESCSAMHWFIP